MLGCISLGRARGWVLWISQFEGKSSLQLGSPSGVFLALNFLKFCRAELGWGSRPRVRGGILGGSLRDIDGDSLWAMLKGFLG